MDHFINKILPYEAELNVRKVFPFLLLSPSTSAKSLFLEIHRIYHAFGEQHMEADKLTTRVI